MRAIGAQFWVQNIQRLSEMLDVATLSCGSISFVFDIAININCRVKFLPSSFSPALTNAAFYPLALTHVTFLSLSLVCVRVCLKSARNNSSFEFNAFNRMMMLANATRVGHCADYLVEFEFNLPMCFGCCSNFSYSHCEPTCQFKLQ